MDKEKRQKMCHTQIYSMSAERRAFTAAAGISGSVFLIRSSVSSQELPEKLLLTCWDLLSDSNLSPLNEFFNHFFLFWKTRNQNLERKPAADLQ